MKSVAKARPSISKKRGGGKPRQDPNVHVEVAFVQKIRAKVFLYIADSATYGELYSHPRTYQITELVCGHDLWGKLAGVDGFYALGGLHEEATFNESYSRVWTTALQDPSWGYCL